MKTETLTLQDDNVKAKSISNGKSCGVKGNFTCDSGEAITKVAIVGAGPVGIRCAKEISKKMKRPCEINVYGSEPYEPYDRIKLSQLLARTIHYPDIFLDVENEINDMGHQDTKISFQNAHIVGIDSHEKKIRDKVGNEFDYDYLILATGSKPHIPHIEGIDLDGVYTFRNINDTEKLISRVNRSRHVIVVGGGLLGLEAAKGLLQSNTKVTLVHQSARLMNRQLNDGPAEELLKIVIAQGISVITNDGLGKIVGNQRVSQIITRHGKRIDCDTVVLCTGIKPNTELALTAGIAFNRGVVVDERLRTSVDNIYAVGECTEFNGEIYGLVAPGLEQASVLADNLSGGDAKFLGTQPYTKLKVMNAAVSSIGQVADLPRRPKLKVITHSREKNKTSNKAGKRAEKKESTVKFYSRSIAIEKGILLGACSVGEWPEIQRAREAFIQRRYLFPWHVWLFRFTGRLWFFQQEDNVLAWPDAAIVCQCNQVTRFSITSSIHAGNVTLGAVNKNCGAGGVCGSCQPLVQNLIDFSLAEDPQLSASSKTNNDKPFQVSTPLIVGCLLALIASSLLFSFPGIQTPTSVQTPSLSWLWTDKFSKQVSGFSLLGITAVGLFLSLRKRLRWEFLGKFSNWRLVHVFLGVVSLGILLAHTGAHLGEHLNRWLMVNYLLAAAIGALAGLAIAVNRHTSIEINIKKISFWMHVLVVWPLPVLISAHIVSSYYF